MRPALLAAVRIAALVAVAVVLLLLLSLPAHQHDWMQQMDPTIGPGAIEDAAGNSRVAAGVVATVGVLAALLAGVTARGRFARWLAVGAAVLVTATWAVKFAGA